MKDVTESASALPGFGSEEPRLFFVRTQAAQLLIDPTSGRIVDANPAACRFYGYSQAELCARYVTDLNTLSAEQVAEAVAQAAAEKRSTFLFPHRLASGEIREVEVRSGPIESAGKTLLLSTIHDVSGRRRPDDTLYMHAQAVGASMDGIAILDDLEKFAYVNAAHARIYGFSRPEELLGRSWRVLYAPAERERVLADVMPAFWAVGHWRGETTGLRQDGTAFPQEISLVAIEGGGFVCEVRDITARKRSDELQSALLRIALATSSVEDMAAFYETIRRIVGELMDAKNLYIALLDEATKMISYPYFVDEVEAPPAPHPLGRGLTEYVLRTGASLLATPADLERLLAAGEAEVVGAPSLDWLAVPLKRGEKTFGVLAVQSYTESTRYTARERDILTFVSSQLASAIDRKRAAEALAESETRFRRLAETAPCAIFIYQGERFSYVNEAAIQIAGYSREEFLSMSFWDVVHTDMRELVWERGLARQHGEEVPASYELKIVRKDGEERWLSFSAGRIELGGPLPPWAPPSTSRRRSARRNRSAPSPITTRSPAFPIGSSSTIASPSPWPRPAERASASRFSSSTSTGSRRSTIRSATTGATSSCAARPRASRDPCAPSTPWLVSGETSSSSCCRASGSWKRRCWSRRKYWRRFAPPSPWKATTCS